jgi:hypothetical protein
MDFAHELKEDMNMAYHRNPDHQTNLEAVNEYLIDVRKNNW